MDRRYILRRHTEAGPESADVVRQLHTRSDVRVLDQGDRYVYLESDSDVVDAFDHLPGWTLTEQRSYPIPSPTPAIERRVVRR